VLWVRPLEAPDDDLVDRRGRRQTRGELPGIVAEIRAPAGIVFNAPRAGRPPRAGGAGPPPATDQAARIRARSSQLALGMEPAAGRLDGPP